MKVRFPLTAAVVAAGAALAFALPIGPAVAVQSDSRPVAQVQFGQRAFLDTNGAVIFAPVNVVCPPGAFTILTVSVAQVVDGDIANGTAFQNTGACTGSVQRFDVSVLPSRNVFRTGPASGEAKLEVCTDSCRAVVDRHTIQIVPRR